MRWIGLHSGGVNGCSGSTQTSKLILSRLGVKGAKVMEKLEIKWCGRRSFSAKTLLQVYGLKISMVNSTLRLGSEKVFGMAQVKLGVLQCCKMFRYRACFMNGPISS